MLGVLRELVIVAVVIVGCNDDPGGFAGTPAESDTDSDTDTDSDADTDTDTDTDSDADTDTDTDTGFSGTLELLMATDEVTYCDTTIALTGTPFAGVCPECDFVYAIESTITSEAGTDCPLEDFWFGALLPSGKGADLLLGFQSYLHGDHNVIWKGYSGPEELFFFYPWLYDGTWSEVSFDGDLLSWEVDYYDNWGAKYEVDFCGGYVGSEYFGYHGGAYSSMSSLPCLSAYYAGYYDRWGFDAPADEYVYIAIDTVSDATTADTYFFVQEPGELCAIAAARDGFVCSYPPPTGSCPSYKLPVTEGQHYTVLVGRGGLCKGADSEYKIVIDASSDPSLVLEDDDHNPYDVRVAIKGELNVGGG